jgi:hypothetical protein
VIRMTPAPTEIGRATQLRDAPQPMKHATAVDHEMEQQNMSEIQHENTQSLLKIRANAFEASKAIRPLLPKLQLLLFHGTRYPRQILRDDALIHPDFANYSVSFSRLLHVATYWALLEREPEQSTGAVLVFNRNLLAQNYKLECQSDPFWEDHQEFSQRKYTEAEEIIYGRDVIDLRKYLIGVAWIKHDGSLLDWWDCQNGAMKRHALAARGRPKRSYREDNRGSAENSIKASPINSWPSVA